MKPYIPELYPDLFTSDCAVDYPTGWWNILNEMCQKLYEERSLYGDESMRIQMIYKDSMYCGAIVSLTQGTQIMYDLIDDFSQRSSYTCQVCGGWGQREGITVLCPSDRGFVNE